MLLWASQHSGLFNAQIDHFRGSHRLLPLTSRVTEIVAIGRPIWPAEYARQLWPH